MKKSSGAQSFIGRAHCIELDGLLFYPNKRILSTGSAFELLTPTEVEFFLQFINRPFEPLTASGLSCASIHVSSGNFRALKHQLFQKLRRLDVKTERIFRNSAVGHKKALQLIVKPLPQYGRPRHADMPEGSLSVFPSPNGIRPGAYLHSFAESFGHFRTKQAKARDPQAREERKNLVLLHPERQTLLIDVSRAAQDIPWSYWKVAIAVRTPTDGEWQPTDLTPYHYLMMKIRVYRDAPDDPVPLIWCPQIRFQDDRYTESYSTYRGTTAYCSSLDKVSRGYKRIYFDLNTIEWFSDEHPSHDFCGMLLPIAKRSNVVEIILDNIELPNNQAHMIIEIDEIAFLKSRLQ